MTATVVIAGGGTGGHVFPAIAVAEAMRRLADVDVVFCGTARGVESRVVPARGFRLEILEAEPLKGSSRVRAVRAGIVAARATLRAFGLVRRLRPRAVLSVGGYAAGPVTLAAALLGIPIAVLEPNSVVGLTNRMLAPFAARAYVAWHHTATHFRTGTSRYYGVPLRAGFEPRPRSVGGKGRVLVLGGSQGAAAFNDRMPEAMARVQRSIPEVSVVHQSGRERDPPVRADYARRGVDRAVVVPFLEDVVSAIADADVIVARGGAGTIAEITAIGRASIVVPLPHAADDHQGRNADELARVGAAVCLRQQTASAERLACEIERLLSADGARVALADAARTLGRPNAAHDVAADLLTLAHVWGRGSESAGAGVDPPPSEDPRREAD